MADYGLKYHIRFPSATPNESILNSKSNKHPLVFKKKSPVVILFGWVGCQDKHLAKYSSIYEEMGCITIRYTAPASGIFFQHKKLSKLAAKFLDLLQEKELDEHPVIFHVFSNGGAFFYQQVSLEMQKRKKTLQIKGMIFDSAPGYKSFYSVYRTFSSLVKGPFWYKVPVSLVIAMISYSVFITWAYIKAIISLKKPETEPMILDEEPFDWPQLFIYSKDDELVKYEDVEKFSTQREKKNIKVTKLCLEKSPHVQHLITHREMYVTTVVNFVRANTS